MTCKISALYDSYEDMIADLNTRLENIRVSDIYRVVDGDTFYRVVALENGFKLEECEDPDKSEKNILIWWMDHVHVRWNNMLRESIHSGNSSKPTLPGNLSLCIDMVSENTKFDGHLIVPINFRNVIDSDSIKDIDTPLSRVLRSHIGIPFGIVHYDIVKHYSGIITTFDLDTPDLCSIREELNKYG